MVMDDDKLKELLQEDMELDADSILEEVNSDPSLEDVVAPEIIHEKLFEQIREHETARSEEEDELIRLGKIYKKKRSRRKYWVLAAAVLCAFALGITSFGGAEKVFEQVRDMFDGKSQTHVDTNGERTIDVKIATEEEAYQKIEDEFGIWPVRLYYLPEGMEFVQFVMEKELQAAQMYYEGNNDEMIIYRVVTNYRSGSTGTDVEDKVLEEYIKTLEGVELQVRKYTVERDDIVRVRVTFMYGDAQYSLFLMGYEDQVIEKIIENLYFS